MPEREVDVLLELALGAQAMGTWRWSPADGTLRLDGGARRICGLADTGSHDAPGPADALLGRLLDAPAREALCELARAALDDAVPLDLELTLRRASDGAPRRVSLRGRALGEPAGAALVGVLLDATERHEALAAMRSAGRLRDDLLAVLAHELRGPLAPIAWSLEAVGRDPLAPRQREALELVRRQVDALRATADALQDAGRVLRGRVPLRLEPVDARAALDEAIARARPALEASGQRIALDRRTGAGRRVRADAARLVQVLAQLLDNAARFGREGGTIRASIDTVDGMAAIAVEDEGVGIDAARLDEVWQPFVRLARPGQAGGGGLGLGLAVAKALVERQGGRIEASSEGEGRGARFVVRLPWADEPAR